MADETEKKINDQGLMRQAERDEKRRFEQLQAEMAEEFEDGLRGLAGGTPEDVFGAPQAAEKVRDQGDGSFGDGRWAQRANQRGIRAFEGD